MGLARFDDVFRRFHYPAGESQVEVKGADGIQTIPIEQVYSKGWV